MIRLALKYNRAWSKNAVGFSRKIGRFTNTRAKDLIRDEIIWTLKGAKIDTSKGVNIFLCLHRKEKRADPQNLVDLFSDAISDGVGVDDRYFTILTTSCDTCKPQETWVEVIITQCNERYSRLLTKTLVDGSNYCDQIVSTSNWASSY